MKILIVVQSLQLGGAERSVVNLAKQWHERGYTILVVTLSGTSADYFTLGETAQRIALDLSDNSRSSLDGIIANIKRIRALRKILVEWKPEIVLGMMTTSAILSILASYRLPVSVVAAERTYPPRSELTKIWQWLRSRTYRYASAVLTQTSDGADWIKLNVKSKKIFVIPNSVTCPLPELEPCLRPELYAMHSDRVLLAVGRLVTEKNHDLLIRACEPLFSKFPNWKLIIIGEGSERTNLERLIQSMNLQKHVLLPGHAGNMSTWYTRADIYVLTSHFEGFPNTLVEALAHGCAAVSLDIKTGPRDLIKHGINGILVSGRKPESLTAALANLMENDSKRMMIALSAKLIGDSLSPNSVAKHWDRLFAQIMGPN